MTAGDPPGATQLSCHPQVGPESSTHMSTAQCQLSSGERLESYRQLAVRSFGAFAKRPCRVELSSSFSSYFVPLAGSFRDRRSLVED